MERSRDLSELRDMRTLRREQLEAAYRAGLVANFTQIRGAEGKPLVWDVETLRGVHVRFESKDLSPFLVGLLHAPTTGIDGARLDYLAGLLSGDVEPTANYTDRDAPGIVSGEPRIGFADLAEFFGVSKDAVWKWARGRGHDLSPILRDVQDQYRPYTHAWTTRRDARHWGQAHGFLNPDGTPSYVLADDRRGKAARRREAGT